MAEKGSEKPSEHDGCLLLRWQRDVLGAATGHVAVHVYARVGGTVTALLCRRFGGQIATNTRPVTLEIPIANRVLTEDTLFGSGLRFGDACSARISLAPFTASALTACSNYGQAGPLWISSTRYLG